MDIKQYNEIQRAFAVRFITMLLFGFVFLYWMGTFGGLELIQPIVENPFLLFLSDVDLAFGYAAALWDREMRDFSRRL